MGIGRRVHWHLQGGCIGVGGRLHCHQREVMIYFQKYFWSHYGDDIELRHPMASSVKKSMFSSKYWNLPDPPFKCISFSWTLVGNDNGKFYRNSLFNMSQLLKLAWHGWRKTSKCKWSSLVTLFLHRRVKWMIIPDCIEISSTGNHRNQSIFNFLFKKNKNFGRNAICRVAQILKK